MGPWLWGGWESVRLGGDVGRVEWVGGFMVCLFI